MSGLFDGARHEKRRLFRVALIQSTGFGQECLRVSQRPMPPTTVMIPIMMIHIILLPSMQEPVQRQASSSRHESKSILLVDAKGETGYRKIRQGRRQQFNGFFCSFHSHPLPLVVTVIIFAFSVHMHLLGFDDSRRAHNAGVDVHRSSLDLCTSLSWVKMAFSS